MNRKRKNISIIGSICSSVVILIAFCMLLTACGNSEEQSSVIEGEAVRFSGYEVQQAETLSLKEDDDAEEDTSTSQEENDIEEETTKTYGDEGVEFVSDDTHFVYQQDDRTYIVYTYNEDKTILKYTKYYDCMDNETATKYLELQMDSGVFTYPEIKDIYVKNQYVVTEYSQTVWQGMDADTLRYMFSNKKIEAETQEDESESTLEISDDDGDTSKQEIINVH